MTDREKPRDDLEALLRLLVPLAQASLFIADHVEDWHSRLSRLWKKAIDIAQQRATEDVQ